jgi:hypothetical protein
MKRAAALFIRGRREGRKTGRQEGAKSGRRESWKAREEEKGILKTLKPAVNGTRMLLV